jgi:hypothetical protein
VLDELTRLNVDRESKRTVAQMKRNLRFMHRFTIAV